MKTTSTVIAYVALLSGVLAIDFSGYSPQKGVQAEFEPFLKALVTAAEDPAATTEYTDYFTKDGMQTTLTIHCVGAAAITKCKNGFLPTDGSKKLIHYPTIVSIFDNNATATVYDSEGRIENTFVGGNCSQIQYKTRYTVLKTTEGENEPPNLTPKPQGQVYWYHDYVVIPTNVPSSIPCDSEKSSTAKRDLPRFVPSPLPALLPSQQRSKLAHAFCNILSPEQKREAMVTNGSRRVHVRVPDPNLKEAHANRRSGNVGHYKINSDATEMEHVQRPFLDKVTEITLDRSNRYHEDLGSVQSIQSFCLNLPADSEEILRYYGQPLLLYSRLRNNLEVIAQNVCRCPGPPQQRHGSDPSTVSCKPPKAGVASRASKGSRHMLSARLSTSSSTTSTGDRFFETDAATQMGVGDFVIEGDMASDKKASWGNVKEPRGVQVLAWGGLSNVVCEEVLGCSSERLYTVWLSMREGQVRNGQFGSNVVAAMFITCGQDAVSVAEASWSHLTMEYNRETKSLKLSLFFLSLPVGVVGGGTGYAAQKASLELLKCHGPGMKRRLAGLTAAFALALDVSTCAAMASGTFTGNHKRLARGGGG
ncbi:Hydroxymethylglutaryl-coenzyme A reductase [Pyrenophora tritici-repentis]|nr:Hydroxymethylglutaryl-coenzyme A reductase [Pyrenophora tritici-repentis]